MSCLGCPNLLYCSVHFKQHRDNLNVDLQQLTDRCNEFREEIDSKRKNSQEYPLLKTIDEWEKASINKIRQLAQQTKEELLRNVDNFIPQVRDQLETLRTNIHQDPDDCEFVDIDIKNWTQELERLKSLLNNPPDLNIREVPTEFIPKIHLEVGSKSEPLEKSALPFPPIPYY